MEVTTYDSFGQFNAVCERTSLAQFITTYLRMVTFATNVSLALHSSYRIGGPAQFFCEPKTVRGLATAVTHARELKLPIFILGGGTNIVFSDAGVFGVVIKPALTRIRVRGTALEAGAGALMADIVSVAIAHGLSGLEWAGGLPGTLGGAIRGNAGAFGGEIKDCLRRVVSLPVQSKRLVAKTSTAAACNFDYRTSVFKEHSGEEIILSAQLYLKRGDKKVIADATAEKIAYRNARHPMEHPNVGSIFKNVAFGTIAPRRRAQFTAVVKTDPFPVVPTAHLIAEAGLRGVSCGGAMISPKHPNFIVNALGATASDVKALARLVKETVRQKFGIELEEEIMYV